MATTLITRTVLAERVQRLLNKNGLSKDNGFDIREIKREIDNAANAILKMEWFGSKKEGDKAVRSHFLAEFTGVSVIDNSGNNYIDIPANYINLPDGLGVFRITPEQTADAGKAMIPLDPYAMDLLSGLPASTFEQQWSYELRRRRVYFNQKGGNTLIAAGVTSVSMTLVVIDPTEISDTDPYPIMADQASEVVRQTVRFFAPSANLYDEAPKKEEQIL